MVQRKIRLGADIGGTFTDIALEVGSDLFSAKILTTPGAPEDAIIEGLGDVCEQAGIQPGDIDQIIHGTTLATNALIERNGAKTALITTRGFRDIIEMRTESRFEQYDLNLVLPEPLLPRDQRFVVSERISARGDVLIGLERAEVQALVDEIVSAGFTSVAVGLIHSYRNDAHEKLVAEVLAERAPHLVVSLSSEVSPQMREYERFNTVVANAYIKPMMKRYLQCLAGRLGERGVKCPIFLMHSGGGIISLKSAAAFPVRLVESGPAGGAVFAAHIARRYGLDRVLSFDMGGTTAKICLIKNQTPKTARVFEAARTYRFKKGSGMPISIPVIDMVEIGAGGGSLAHVDALRQIRVGPRSAGSEPGPACYGRGGINPAVTDADLLLGRLDADNFAGGSMSLNKDNAESAIRRHIGAKLDMDEQTAAFAICEVVDENMANAARVHAVENGEDLSTYTMIAFGGAAPLHAARLCEKLGIARLLVPPGAGVGSALGFLRAPFAFEANRSHYMRLADFDAAAARRLFAELVDEAVAFVGECDTDAGIHSTYRVYMRYVGQGEEIAVPLAAQDVTDPRQSVFQERFEKQYTALFSRIVDDMDMEITGWSVNVSTVQPPPPRIAPLAGEEAAAHSGTRPLFDPATADSVTAKVVQRHGFAAGQTVSGPAVITENETTIIVPANRCAIAQSDGCIDLVVPDTAANARQEAASRQSDVAHQVMWNRMIAVVEEQAQALIRTAFSTSVREAGDLSAGVYDVQGRMLAQAVTGTPGHVNAMAESVGHFIRRIGYDAIHEGDVYVTNDPWEGTGHLHDITMVTPSFKNASLIGFLACTAHVVDIGGRGFGADADSVYEEGLYLPVMKFAERGTVNQTLLHIIRANVREPQQVVGDFHALATCNEVGHRRLMEMMEEFSLNDLSGISRFILEHSGRATAEQIAALHRRCERSSASGSMTIDGYSGPVTLCVSLTVNADTLNCDFTGTSGIDKKGINVPLVYTQAYACYALKCAIAPDIPNNAASLAPFLITAPENSIVNASHPAPVALRHVIGHMIPDAVYAALDQIIPNLVPAEGAGTLCNFQISLRPTEALNGQGQRAEVLTFNSGGAGARPTLDGMNATAFPSGVMTMPVEATEHTGPIVIWRKELRPDSGGAGKFRGGLGQLMEIGAVHDHEFDFSAMFDRVQHPARGRRGGCDGAATKISREDDSPMRGKGKQFVPAGGRVKLAFPGGAGHGDPARRDPELVRRDLALGYISIAAARRDYGFTDKKAN